MIVIALSADQIIVGLAILCAGLVLSATAVDEGTPKAIKWPVVGLMGWAVWFALQPLAHGPDSPPAIAFAGLVAFVLTKHRTDVLLLLGLSVKGNP